MSERKDRGWLFRLENMNLNFHELPRSECNAKYMNSMKQRQYGRRGWSKNAPEYSKSHSKIQKKFLQFVVVVVSGMHHYECVPPNVDINLQSGRFWDMSIASFTDRFIDFRSCWIVFIHVLRGRPDGLLQFSGGGEVIRSAWHLIRLAFAQCGRRGRDAVLEQ